MTCLRTPGAILVLTLCLTATAAHAQDEPITGDWDGQRTLLKQAGFQIDAAVTIDAVKTLRGGLSTNGATFLHLFEASLTVDAETAFGWDNGGRFFTKFVNKTGDDPDADVGSFHTLNNSTAYDAHDGTNSNLDVIMELNLGFGYFKVVSYTQGPDSECWSVGCPLDGPRLLVDVQGPGTGDVPGMALGSYRVDGFPSGTGSDQGMSTAQGPGCVGTSCRVQKKSSNSVDNRGYL